MDHNNHKVVSGSNQAEERAAYFLRAVELVLRPIARMLIRRGIGMRAIAETVRRAALAGAADVIKEQGLPVTPARLQIYTSLPRAEVQRILSQLADSVDLSETRFAKITRLFTTWHLDHRYALPFVDTPRDLPVEATEGDLSFYGLVEECAPGVDAKELLEELVRTEQVRIHPDTGHVHLRARAYIPEPFEISDSERFGRMLGHYALTLDINSRKEGPGKGRFDRHVSADFPISEEDQAEFHRLCREEGQKLLENLDRWLSGRRRVAEDGKRVGLAMFHYVEVDGNATGERKEDSTARKDAGAHEDTDENQVIDTLTFRGTK